MRRHQRNICVYEPTANENKCQSVSAHYLCLSVAPLHCITVAMNRSYWILQVCYHIRMTCIYIIIACILLSC